MCSETPDRPALDRRAFLKTAGATAAGAAALPYLGWSWAEGRPDAGALSGAADAVPTGWVVRPFALSQVRLGESLFTGKRDRMLHYARSYGGTADPFAGPDRLLSTFRANAGLDTRGAEAVGGWESATGYLRGHYTGHFMSMLSQAWAGSGDTLYRRKLDYIVSGLAECQAALAAAAKEPTPRVSGPHGGGALRLSGSPIGLAEHVRLPAGVVDGLRDFTIATWIEVREYDAAKLPPSNRNQGPSTLNNQAAVFDFGSPNPAYAEPPLAHMYLIVRESDRRPVPRFAITTSGRDGEQAVEGKEPLPVNAWTHLAVTRSGSTVTLWVNGAAVARSDAVTLAPADLGGTKDNWLGRRQFPQRSVSYLNASLADFRIHARALAADEVRALAAGTPGGGHGDEVVRYRFAEAGGPTAVDASGHGRDGWIVAPTDGRRHPGFLAAYPETQYIRLEEFCTYGSTQGIWAPYYTLHKIMAGLLDAHTLAGNRQALEILTGLGDWAYGRLAELEEARLRRMWDIYIAGEYGGVNESLAELHALTGKDEYLAAARRFDNLAVLAPTIVGADILDGRHANQHIPQFTGYLRVFEQGAGQDYHTAAAHFWDMVVPHRIYSHGGMGVNEMFRKRDVIAGSLYEDRDHAETCPLYNMLKLSRNLFFHDPDPKYMNYYELGLFNQILGSRRDVESAESPEVTYFVPVQPGRNREYGNVGTCCGGTGMENHTKYQDSIYFRSADGATLYVNLYIPSTLRWEERGLTITQDTGYPLEGASRITVEGHGALAVKLRVPVWVRKGYTVRVNGQEQRLDAKPGTYVTIERTWSTGDRIDIAMPFTFHAEPTIDDPAVQAIYHGPVLMAVQSPPVGDDLATGLIPMGFYASMKLDGDLAPAMTPAAEPGFYASNGHTLAPFHVADPQAGDTHPYHVYVRRHEPRVVFGSIDSGVDNPAREGGVTLLDEVWAGAPFADHAAFVARVERISARWQDEEKLTPRARTAIVAAARRAERAMRV